MSTLSASSPVCPQRVASLRLALEQWDARQARTSKSASGVPQPADMIAKMAALRTQYEELNARLQQQQQQHAGKSGALPTESAPPAKLSVESKTAHASTKRKRVSAAPLLLLQQSARRPPHQQSSLASSVRVSALKPIPDAALTPTAAGAAASQHQQHVVAALSIPAAPAPVPITSTSSASTVALPRHPHSLGLLGLKHAPAALRTPSVLLGTARQALKRGGSAVTAMAGGGGLFARLSHVHGGGVAASFPPSSHHTVSEDEPRQQQQQSVPPTSPHEGACAFDDTDDDAMMLQHDLAIEEEIRAAAAPAAAAVAAPFHSCPITTDAAAADTVPPSVLSSSRRPTRASAATPPSPITHDPFALDDESEDAHAAEPHAEDNNDGDSDGEKRDAGLRAGMRLSSRRRNAPAAIRPRTRSARGAASSSAAAAMPPAVSQTVTVAGSRSCRQGTKRSRRVISTSEEEEEEEDDHDDAYEGDEKPRRRGPAAASSRAAAEAVFDENDDDNFIDDHGSGHSSSFYESSVDEDAPISSLRREAAASFPSAAIVPATSASEKKQKPTKERKPRATTAAPKKPRTVVSANYVRSDNKHKIANGTGRAGKSAKALRKEKWRLLQGVPRWKGRAAHARDKREQEQLALYNDCLTPAELAKQVAASVDAEALAAAGADAGDASGDEGTDDELEQLKALETAEFGQSSVRTRRDRAVEAVAAAEAARRDAQQDAEANMPAARLAKLAAADSAAAAARCNAQARSKDPSSYTAAALRSVLQCQFGYKDFRPGQLETIQRVLGCYPAPLPPSSSPNNSSGNSHSSNHNVLSILPTGGGKSLIYQLLSYLLPGLTLVVSPLLSLMRDQVEHLPHFLPGAVWSSELDGREVLALMTRLQRGEIKVLFVSPEKLLTDAFQNFLLEHICEHSFSAQCSGGGSPAAAMKGALSSLSPLSSRPGLSLCVVDEAHCMAEWSHNFRTAYARLDFVLHNRLRIPRILGLTATATTSTVAAVASHLRIDLPSSNDGGYGASGGNVVRAPLRRSNLVLSSSRVSHEGRFQAILGLLSMPPFKGLHSIIIYVSFQKSAEALAKFLTQQGGLGAVAFYHGGLTLVQRHAVQSKFMRNKLSIVVATCAFGMGLDKRDIRGVVHAGMPRSLEAYVQEIGRAGRDGCLSYCHTLWDDSDEVIARSLMYTNGVDKHQLRRLLGQMIFTPQVAEALARVRARAVAAAAGRGLMSDDDGEQDEENGDDEDRPLSRKLVYVALDVEQLRTSLDLSEEVVGTILARLERSGVGGGDGGASTSIMGPCTGSSSIPPWIRLVACVHNTASIGFHKTHPKVLAQTSPVIRALLEQNKWIQPSAAYGAGSDTIAFDHERASTNFAAASSASTVVGGLSSSHTPDFSSAEFAQLKQQKGLLGLNMIDAAMALSMDVGAVQRELVRLRAAGEINVQWSDMSFLVQVLRCPRDEDPEAAMSGFAASAAEAAAAMSGVPTFESVVESVHAFLQSQECSSATKLSIVSTALKIAALPSMRCTATDAVQRGRRMLAAHAKLMRAAAPSVIAPSTSQLPSGSAMTDTDPSMSAAVVDSAHDNSNDDEEPEYFDLHLVIDAYFQADDHAAFLAQLEAQLAEATLQDSQTRTGGGGGGGGNKGAASNESSASSAAARAAAAAAASTAAAVAKSHLQLEREVESDLASFVRSYGDSLRSGREVARIFHGLHAPSAAAQSRSAESAARFQARRDPHNSAAVENGPSLSAFAGAGSPYWGRHRAVPFPQVLALAERALQEYKLGAPERAVQQAEEARLRREKKRQKLASHVHLAPPPQPKPLLPPSRSITTIPATGAAAAPSSIALSSSSSVGAAAAPVPVPATEDDDVLIAASDVEEEGEAESDEY